MHLNGIVDPVQRRRGKSALEWANPPKTKLYWRTELLKFGRRGGNRKEILLLLRVSSRDL